MSKDIHEAINNVMQEVGYVKKQKGANLSYTYAGESALISALRPAMVEHGIYMHVLKIENVTRESYVSKNGAAMTNTVISATIRLAHISGTFIDVASTGEGSDAGDKSANKAMTGLYKYAMRQTFCIETGDDPDKFASEEKRIEKPAKELPLDSQVPAPKKATPAANPERTALVKEFSAGFNALKNKAGSKTISGNSTIEEIKTAIAHNKALTQEGK